MTGTPTPFPGSAERPVCVFCASSPGNVPLYTTAAAALGQALAAANIPVVYGGGRRGIMGVVSQSTLQAGGNVHGVLPKALVTRASEFTPAPSSASTPPPGATSSSGAKPSGIITPSGAVSAEGKGADLLAVDFDGRLTMEVVGSMHERKAKMAKLSTGGFIVLPGGFGTFEELMEMVTWNQIGMHALPVIVLNVGNFYTPMKALIANGVRAGFISEKNAQLVQIVDLGSEADNESEERGAEWGPLALKTLQEWRFPNGAGYGFKWDEEKKTSDQVQAPGAGTAGAAASSAATTAAATATATAAVAADAEVPYLFSTGRYTSPSAARTQVTQAHIPLWPYHVARLRRAHGHFAEAPGPAGAQWGEWVGDAELWEAVRSAVQAREDEGRGDWRIRMVVHAGPRLEIQVVPAPAGIAPFSWSPPATPTPTRQMYLDTTATPSADPAFLGYRQHKTAERRVYDAAAARAVAGGAPAHSEVVLHAGGALLEGVTSNIALWVASQGWVTPRIGGPTPVLAGAMRAYLLDTGVVREGELGVDDWEAARREGGRVIAFNALRGVWEAELCEL